MVYFTSRHTSTEQGSDRNNSKDEKQPLLSCDSHGQYNSTIKRPSSTKHFKSYSSSCTTPTDGLDALVPPVKRLAHLRRLTWSDHSHGTPSPTNDQFYDDPPTPIRLPTSHNLILTDNAINCELQRLVSWTLCACVICPIWATAVVFISPENSRRYMWIQQSLQPLLTVFWCLLAVFWKHHPERLQSFTLWAQTTCLFTLLSLLAIPALFHAHESIYIIGAIQLLSLCLFVVARRLDRADERQRLGYLQRMRDQHGLAQRLINEQTFNYAQRRLAFLSAVSNEIQDAALMILTTLEQFSPAVVFNSPQELLSACSIAVPITSITAIHTTIKQVCHISSHLQLMSCLVQETHSSTSNGSTYLDDQPLKSNIRQSFDIGELAQNSGDALAGMASKLDVNMVLYHSDNSLHHTRIIGDEAAFKHAILGLIRNILEGSTPGACIELGLNLTPVENDKKKVTVTFEITHTCSPAIPKHLSSPSFLLPNTTLTTQLIRYIGGRLSINTLTNSRTRFDMAVEVDLGDNSDDCLLFIGDTSTTGTTSPLHKSYHHIKFATEPTIKELTKFMEHLKGLKMVLHAKEQSVFAKHLTGCLASWNSDISHVPVTSLDDDNETIMNETCSTPGSEGDALSAFTDSVIDYQHHQQPRLRHHTTSTTSSLVSLRSAPVNTPPVPSPATEEEHILSIPPTFVLIDDHIMTLEHKLLEFRTHPPALSGRRHKHSKKNQHGPTTAIIHFTSLANYKRVRDTIQWASTLTTPFAMPRVVVVPKPAGPRRYLTALHTVWHNAMVEPHYIPIATSPSSPVPTVLLSSMLSQVVDHPSGTTPPTPNNETQHLHPHHRPRRPASGVYSPSFIQMQLQQHEGSNYFFDRSGSPLPRRRSHQNEPMDHIANSEKTMDHTEETGTVLVENAATETASTGRGESEQGNKEAPPAQDEPEPAKPIHRLAKNIKINKRKKKDKGSPFSNAVSPPINVLIVEDNMINQAILSAWMKKHKIKFSVASNGQEAVEKWEGGGFHLILMDIQLPVMSGIDATRTIRSIEKEQKIGVLPMSSSFLQRQRGDESPTTVVSSTHSSDSTFRSPVIIVALTASSLESDRHAALAAGCNDFLTKPVSLEWLEKKIIEWGCMQALIDFEGWRRWKRSTNDTDVQSWVSQQPDTPRLAPDEQPKELPRQGILLPGAIGWNKRRFSTMDHHGGLRRHNTTFVNQGKYTPTLINRTASFSRFPIQKSYSASTPGVRRQTTKKAVSMDDSMKSGD